ncbi:MAG: DUF3035 domain-containing protein [Alphaproteobacteria bacterium]
MNKLFILGLSAACMALAACSTATKEKLGLTKKAPNEFLVVPRAPLSLPPEYDSETGRRSSARGRQQRRVIGSGTRFDFTTGKQKLAYMQKKLINILFLC